MPSRNALLLAALFLLPAAVFSQTREAAPRPPSLSPAGALVLDALGVPSAAELPKAAIYPGYDARLEAFIQRAAQAPAAAPAKAARATAPQVLSAARTQLSSFTPQQLKTMAPEDLDALAARIMDGARDISRQSAAQAREDLPGAGREPELTDKDVDDLLALPTERPVGYPSTGTLDKILKSPARWHGALADQILTKDPNLSKIMLDFYLAFAAAVRAGPPQRALALQRRFEGFLAALRAPGSPVHYRVHAGRASHRMLKSGALLEDSLRAKEVSAKVARLKSLLGPLTGQPQPETAPSAAQGPWEIPLPQERAAAPPAAEVHYTDLRRIGAKADARAFALGKLLKRLELAQRPGFSAKLRESLEAQRREMAEDNADWLEVVEHTLMQHTGNRLPNQLMNPRWGPGSLEPLFVPTNPNLALVVLPEGQGMELRADFTTDITDDKALAFIKESIETYWAADIETAAGVMPFRTRIEIRKLRPGESFGKDDLRLTESPYFGNHGTAQGLALTRQGIGYGVPAHEFGHVLGLPDEYRIDYDARNRRYKQTSYPASLMSSSESGSLQLEHVQTVTRLMAEGGRLYNASAPSSARKSSGKRSAGKKRRRAPTSRTR